MAGSNHEKMLETSGDAVSSASAIWDIQLVHWAACWSSGTVVHTTPSWMPETYTEIVWAKNPGSRASGAAAEGRSTGRPFPTSRSSMEHAMEPFCTVTKSLTIYIFRQRHGSFEVIVQNASDKTVGVL
ncbi:hypothetical protein AURDEDRAFT_176923 [Auricularia subglabra TFB-10046 SS5]|uniref:Uncharacterized protein n=1 Tax=Auricularia subglabra (strain TFB-10046 / SS5) TaxID=717982 RepID=J0WNR9_AURST|nr:hypothetical protein AURDEDRAFT_176923 [Auricularia subglabra TFB-10046 SS5]